MTKEQLAKISSAGTRFDHGCLSIWIFVDYEEGMSQGICGLVMDDFVKSEKRRIGTAWGCDLLLRLLLEFGINDLSELKGRHCFVIGNNVGIRALRGDDGLNKGVTFRDKLEKN